MLAALTRQLRQNVAQLGWRDAGFYFLARALPRLGLRLYKYEFVAQPIAAAPLAQGRGKAIAVRLASQLDGVPGDYPRPRHVVADRFDQGAETLQAWKGETLAGFLWLLHHGYREDEVRASYRLASAASVWDFDVYVAPEFRLGPTYLRLWDEANALLRERGVHWTCSRISSFNVASRRAHGRLGTVRLAGAVFLCAGRWQLSFISQAPYLHLSRGAHDAPRLSFDTAALALPVQAPPVMAPRTQTSPARTPSRASSSQTQPAEAAPRTSPPASPVQTSPAQTSPTQSPPARNPPAQTMPR